jgi:hypothetical protein
LDYSIREGEVIREGVKVIGGGMGKGEGEGSERGGGEKQKGKLVWEERERDGT